MSPMQRRFKNVINRIGEAFTVSGSPRQGIFAFITSGQAGTYIDFATLDSLPRPLRAAYVPFDDTTAGGDTVSYGGLSLTVEKAVDLRHANEAVARLLILA